MRKAKWCCAILFAAALSVNAAFAQPVRIGIPERNNLQFISFWTAQGAGFFKAEGLDIEIVHPDVSNLSGMILMQGRVDVALLQPPVYLGLIAEQHPFVLFAARTQRPQSRRSAGAAAAAAHPVRRSRTQCR